MPCRLILLSALALGGTSACVSPIEAVPVILWEGNLEGQLPDVGAVSASVAMVANEFTTQIGIGIQAGDQGVSLRWVVRQGACGASGLAVVDESTFGPLTSDASGEASSELVVNRRLDTRATYSAEIALNQGDVVACGELERLN